MYSTFTVFDLNIWQNPMKGEGFFGCFPTMPE